MYGINLNRQSELPLWRQIYHSLKEQIISGRLKEDEPLPSTRELAKNIGVSRNTVSEAYEMLITEGFVVSQQGAPTRVAKGLFLEKITSPQTPEKSKPLPTLVADFHTGRPDLKALPPLPVAADPA